MRAWVVAALVAVLAACTATPDLEYAFVPGDASTSGGDAGHDGATSGGLDAALDATGSSSGIVDAAPDGPNSCPAVPDAGGVGCCTNVMRGCIGMSCSNCGDCRSAGCSPTQYCCPTLNPQGRYRGTVCRDTPGC
jgi:hypothetical protein